MENAILYAGVEELNTIKEHVLELNGYQEKNAELLKEETRLAKLVAGKEKDLADEIENTVKKRKQELGLSWGGKEVGSPCEWRGGARLYSQVIVGESGLETC